MNALEIEALDIHDARPQPFHGLTLSVGQSKIVTVLGNKSAGKTLSLSAVPSVVRSSSSTMRAFGRDISDGRPRDTSRRDIGHVREGWHIFSWVTNRENLQLGGYLVNDNTVVGERTQEVYPMLPRMAERSNQQGGTPSGGEQEVVVGDSSVVNACLGARRVA